MIAPSAIAFALVAVAAAVMAVGGLGESLTGPAATGGFAATGAILLALAVIASEEIAVLPFLHGSYAAELLQAQVPTSAAIDHNAPFNSLARAAIGASHQGVFDLDFRAGLLTLSQEAAQMVGLSVQETTLNHGDWVALVHPDDREVYTKALEEYRHRPGMAFRLEFRARGGSGPYRWLELRATIVSEQQVPSDCLGLLSDITQRKETEFAQLSAEAAKKREAALPRDALTGLGNRVALMEALDALGAGFDKALFALLDVDRFKAIHASLGDAGADALLRQIGERLAGLGEPAQIFRVGGDSFAFLFANPRRAPQPIGNALAENLSKPYGVDGREVFAPCSIGLATGAQSEDPFALIKNAELALIAAKKQGGACARLYSNELENLAPGDSVALESELRHALASDQIDVFYQPIIRMADRSVAGFEALLRWQHPVKGLVSPRRFHRPFGRDRADRGAGAAGAGTRGVRPGALAALFSPEAGFVRQRQCLAPPVEGCGFRGAAQDHPGGQRHRPGLAEPGNHRIRHRRRSQDAPDHGPPARAGRQPVDRRFRHRRLQPQRVPEPAGRHREDRQELPGAPWRHRHRYRRRSRAVGNCRPGP